MRARKILNVVFGLIVAVFGIVGLASAFFPRIHNDLSCDDSVPDNPAEQVALRDAQSRLPAECAPSRARCKLAIHDSFDPDGTFRISPHVVETDFFQGCIYKYAPLDFFIYDRNGRFLRTEGAPYGLS